MSLYTSQDAMYYLLTTVGGGSQDLEQRILRSAISHAYRDVTFARDWLWHTASEEIVTEYAATSLIEGQQSRVATEYLLPHGCKNIDSLFTPQPDGTPKGLFFWQYLSPTDFNRFMSQGFIDFPDAYFTVIPAGPQFHNRWKLCISNQLAAGTTMQFTYRRQPKDLVLFGSEPHSRTGTISIPALGYEVTGTSTNFPARAAGSVLRLSSNATNVPEPTDGLYPYVWQGLIDRVDSDTSLSLMESMEADYTGVRYCISDYLDVSPGMFTAVLSYSELWYARLSGKPIDTAAAVASRDIRAAFETDQVVPISGRRRPHALPSWANALAFPTRI